MLHLTNTLTGKKEPFRPLNPGRAGLYVCGVTVYDDCHIGHARGAVVFDVLRRFLEREGLRVIHVRNVTDVDDKIIDRARGQPGEGDLKARAAAVAGRYIESFRRDFGRLGLLPPTHEPQATQFIGPMQRFIEALLARGAAYAAEDGVYFSVRKAAGYGRLSRQRPDQMREGVRIEPGAGKRDPLDFALWKRAKPEEPAWESPWGPGRPGWHIECSTMSTDLLGDAFDIHGGGQDLIFPHHENELAQAEGAGKPFARVWLHNGLLTVEGAKMSKSLGNIISIGEVLRRHPAPVLRLFYLSAHYRSPQDFSWDRIKETAAAYERIREFLLQVRQRVGEGKVAEPEAVRQAREKFRAGMEDDLNTPAALSALFELVTRAYPWFNGLEVSGEGKLRAEWLRAAAQVLEDLSGVLGLTFPAEEVPEAVRRRVEERDRARKEKAFEKADAIRRELTAQGYLLEDTGGKTVIRKRGEET